VGAEICSTEHCYCQATWHHIQQDQNSDICWREVGSAEFIRILGSSCFLSLFYNSTAEILNSPATYPGWS